MKKIIYILILTCIPSYVLAQNAIDKILMSVSENNLELKSSEADIQGQTYSLKATNNLNDPNVDLDYTFGGKGIGNKWDITVTQAFDWPGLYSSRSKGNKARISALSYLHMMKRMEILLQAKQICIDIININKQIEMQQKVYDNIDNLYQLYQKGFEHGEINILDINKLKIERVNTNQVLTELFMQRKVVTESLKALNGNVPLNENVLSALKDYPSAEIKSLSYYSDPVSNEDPEINYGSKSVEADKIDIKNSKLGWFPSFSVGYKHSNETGISFDGFVVGVSIPLFSNRNKVKAAEAAYLSKSLMQQNLQVSKSTKINAQYSALLILNKQINDYEGALNDTHNFDLLYKALKGGQISLLEYLVESKYFLDAQKNLLSIEYSFNQQLAELEKYSLE